LAQHARTHVAGVEDQSIRPAAYLRDQPRESLQ
jgi:hypothetical protein